MRLEPWGINNSPSDMWAMAASCSFWQIWGFGIWGGLGVHFELGVKNAVNEMSPVHIFLSMCHWWVVDNANVHFPANRQVYILMIFRTRGHVRDILKPVFLTLEPPKYLHWSRNNTHAFLRFFSNRSSLENRKKWKDACWNTIDIGSIIFFISWIQKLYA